MKSFNHKTFFILLLVYAVYGIVYQIWGEKVPLGVGEGLGWDGKTYGDAVARFPEILRDKSINMFYIQRILPSGVVFFITQILGLDNTNVNVIKAVFGGYNYVLTLLIMFVWWLICKKQHYNNVISIGGLLSLMFMFPIAKLNGYYVVLTDTTAIVLGMWAVYAYLCNQNLTLLLITILGAFTWPIVIIALPCLIIFKKSYVFAIQENDKINKKIQIILTICLFFLALTFGVHYKAYGFNFSNHKIFDLVLYVLGCFAFAFTGIFLFRKYIAIDFLAEIKSFIKSPLTQLNLVWLFASLAVFVLVKWYASGFLPMQGVVGFTGYIVRIIKFASTWPFYPILSHIVFYGPLIILCCFNWKSIMDTVFLHGVGMALFVFLNIIQVFDPETRHLNFFLPFLLFFLAETLRNTNFSSNFKLLYVAVALLASKVWLVINTPKFIYNIDFTDTYTPEDMAKVDIETTQRYFMNFGTFMTYNSYMIQLIVLVPIILLFNYLLNKKINTLNA